MRPPAAARALVWLLADAEDRHFLLEDLADRFDEVARTDGPRAARRWYWRQALSVVPWAVRARLDPLRWRSWTGMVGDLRSGARTLVRHPLYAVGVSGTIALGLAAATLAFAVTWPVWLAPLPLPDPDRVVRLYEIEPPSPGAASSEGTPESRRQRLSTTLLGDLHAHAFRTVEAVSWVATPQRTWIRGGERQAVATLELSPEGLGILGIVPLLGRLPAAPQGGEATEILLSERFWRTAFGGDPDVVGAQMTLAGSGAATVVGVARLPSGYPGGADIVKLAPWVHTVMEDRGFRHVEVIARVRPGHSVAAAEEELNAFLAALAERHPEHRGWRLEAAVLRDDLVRPFRAALALLLAAGATFLLLACVNVLGLVAARRVDGRHDRSIRLALGASEGRLLRGSLVEGLVLAAVGSAAGVLGAYALVGPLRSLVPYHVPRLDDVAVTAPLAIGGLALGAALGAVLGLCGYLVSRGVKPAVGRAPMWRVVGTGGRRALVVGQVALTTLLIAGGAAIVQRVAMLSALDLGYDPEGVSTTSTILRDVPRNRHPEARWRFARAMLDALEQRGVLAAMAVNTPMMAGDDIPQLGIRADSASPEIVYEAHFVSPNYFAVMGIELLAGRDFGPDDRASSRPVVIVSEEFVERYFGAGTPVQSVVGREIAPLIYQETRPTVVGVVRSTRHRSPEAPVAPEIYTPLSQLAVDAMTLVVRGEPEQVAGAVAAAAAQVDAEQRWSPLVEYTTYLREWFAPLRLQVLLIGVLGALGLLLAALGLYALIAYQVAVRRQELGIRKAVGASDGRLLREVLAGGAAVAAAGAAIGLGIWYRLLPLAGEFLDGIDGGGALVPVSTTVVVGASCVLAMLVPAVRAMRVDPVATLKAE